MIHTLRILAGRPMASPLASKTQYLRMADTLENLPRILTSARRSRGLTLAQLADQIGSTVPHLSNIEHGRRGLGTDLSVRILRWLGGVTTGGTDG